MFSQNIRLRTLLYVELYSQYSCEKLFSVFLIKNLHFSLYFPLFFFKNSTLFFVNFGLTESLEALCLIRGIISVK